MSAQEKRVQFILKQRYVYGQYTKAYGLYNSCEFVARSLSQEGLTTDTVQVVDNNGIDREVARFRPTDCFIEALWCVPDKFRVLARLHPKVRWHIRLHSKTPFLAVEGMAFEWIRAYADLRREGIDIWLSPNAHSLFDELKMIFPGCVNHTPNIYNPNPDIEVTPVDINRESDEELHVGLFGALRPLKNHLQQAMWAIRFAEEVERCPLALHVNISEHEKEKTEPVLRNIRSLFVDSKHRLIEHPWMPHAEFLSLVKQMDLGLQVSFSETYNIVAADHVSQGVPIVVSPDITFVNPFSIVSPTDSAGAIRAINRTLLLKPFLCPINKALLKISNRSAMYWWKKTLEI
jgi:hypothetical protein